MVGRRRGIAVGRSMAAVVGAVALMAAVAVPMATSATAAPKAKPKSVSGLYYTVVANIATGYPYGLAYWDAPTGFNDALYVAAADDVDVIDPATNAVTSTIDIPYRPVGLALGYDDTLYVAIQGSCCAGPGLVGRVNPRTNALDDSASTGISYNNLYSLAVVGDDTLGDDTVYIARQSSTSVIAMNASPFGAFGQIATTNTSSPRSLAVSRDETVYVPTPSFAQPPSLTVIRSSDDTVVATVTLGGEPTGVAVTEDDTVYVTNDDSDIVQVVDGRTNTLLSSISVGDSPQSIAYDPVLNRLYVGNNAAGTLSVINTVTNTVDETVDLDGKKPNYGIAVSPDGSKVYVGTLTPANAGYVTVISVSTSPPTPPTPAPVYPPGAPTEVTAVAGDTSAEVSWTAPAYVGSYPITNYQVTASPGGQTCLASAPSLTCTVLGLTNGVTYTFRARALNGAGWGPDSEPSNAVTPQSRKPRLTLNQGTRVADGGHDRIITTGNSVNVPAGVRLTPYIRYSGQSAFTEGKATITVESDGTFRWSRKIRKDRGITAYVAWEGVSSNQVFWAKIR